MSRDHVFTLLPYRVCRLLLTLVAMTFAVAFAFAHSAVAIGGLNDGLTDQERTEVYNQIAASHIIDEGYRGIVNVDTSRPTAYFGMYRFSQMTQPGWTLFENTIDWAISHQSHATARI
ncbi:MAG: hypothetical protein ACE5FH_03980 [Candidatus Zixiibacteriota bacterium]